MKSSGKYKSAVKKKIEILTQTDFEVLISRLSGITNFKLEASQSAPKPMKPLKPIEKPQNIGKKAIFMCGSAGSGKSNVISKLQLEKYGFKIVSMDIPLEKLKKQHNIPER